MKIECANIARAKGAFVAHLLQIINHLAGAKSLEQKHVQVVDARRNLGGPRSGSLVAVVSQI